MQTIPVNIKSKGYAPVLAKNFTLSDQQSNSLNKFRNIYHSMPVDPHLNPGEGERFRMYARFQIDPLTFELALFPHDSFYQSKTYDVLYGDIHREFPPISNEVLTNTFFTELLGDNFKNFPIPSQFKNEPFEISVHMIRIAATVNSKKGRPAPEGIHRDGYHFAAIHLMDRYNVTGAENRIYSLDKKVIDRMTLQEPMDSILFDDAKIFHGVEPFFASDKSKDAHRDMLILLYQPVSESPQKKATPMPLH